MRILECSDGKLKLTKDLIHDISRYAILSHTWGPYTEEATFRDLVDGTGEDKIGYEKIRLCAELNTTSAGFYSVRVLLGGIRAAKRKPTQGSWPFTGPSQVACILQKEGASLPL